MVDNSFDKSFRLLSAKDFSYLKLKSKYHRNKWLMAYYKPTRLDSSQSRIGLAVSKKVGNAVVRNKFKRVLRDKFRLSNLKCLGFDILIVVSPFLTKKISGIDNQSLKLQHAFDELAASFKD